MIWLKDGHNLKGYVPHLDKEFTEEEIRTINSHCDSTDWCKLSKLIMMTQGIAFKYDGGLYMQKKTDVLSLDMIKFDFSFECLPRPRSLDEEKYLKDIHHVLSYLTLYKVTQRTAQTVYEEILEAKVHWGYFVSDNTINDMLDDCTATLKKAENTVENINALKEAFLRSNMEMPNIFCDEKPDFNYKTDRLAKATYIL